MAFVFYFQLYLRFMLLNDQENLLGEFNLLFKEKTHLKIVYPFFYYIHFDPTPALQIIVICQVDNIP